MMKAMAGLLFFFGVAYLTNSPVVAVLVTVVAMATAEEILHRG